jgi:aryl-alcohol dehydrogenase-like predicted oxidoreductase
MEYTTLGDTGTKVSRVCLGCMCFGSSDRRDWVLNEAESRPTIERAIELGINFFNTANMCSTGDSERILGSVLADYDRDWPVVATKVYNPMEKANPNARGLSGKAIEQYLGASSMWAYQFADAIHTSDRPGLARSVTMQNHHNLVYRGEERETPPL